MMRVSEAKKPNNIRMKYLVYFEDTIIIINNVLMMV